MQSLRGRNLVQITSFAIGTGTQAMLGFFAIPLLVRLLGVEELGRWSIIDAGFQIGAQVALLGFNQTLVKFIASDGNAPWPALLRVVRTLVPSIVVASIAAAAAAHYWLGLPVGSAVAVGILLCLECWMVLALSTSRAASLPVLFSSALITRGGCILAVLAFGVAVRPGWINSATDVIWVWDGAYLIVGVLLAILLPRRARPGQGPDRQAIAGGFRYGMPLLAALLLAQLLQFSDRFFVAGQLGYVDAGRYFVHSKVANTLAMAALPVQLWWPVARFEHLKDADGGSAFFARASLIGVGFFSVMLLAVAAVGPWIFRWFAPSQPLDLLLLLLLISAVYVQAAAIFFNVGLLEVGATHLNVVVWGVTAVVQLSLQVILVPLLGVTGAALGLLVGALCALVMQFAMSQRRRYVQFPLVSLLTVAAAGLGSAILILRVAA